ncbi:SoxR reducing system RseC family protein [Endozoicomonas sp. 8E]|uniref:SoxR reducing system RseC family protein n=1 Tax=Endozoicomonas sp. 8E TaxID=3035692 RepID=UPI002938DD9E|nr:SoxR reducing system RseC family protein [Endozoicomonas sp. 8E]WOG25567.1 SoxR reducing system RseC family protein [Endozoicomonas sp. 8E]
MIEEEGRVVAVEQGTVWVETIRKSTCSSCSVRNGCGQNLLEKYRSNKHQSYIQAINDFSIEENDQVIIGIPESALMRASFLVYLMPLAGMMGALWLATAVGWNDFFTALSAMTGLAAGFVPVRMLGQSTSDLCRVRVIKVLPRKVVGSELITIDQSWSA